VIIAEANGRSAAVAGPVSLRSAGSAGAGLGEHGHRDECYEPGSELPGETDVLVRKKRHGAAGRDRADP
jgi:hypothetical protein